jgi:hypothetical protein
LHRHVSFEMLQPSSFSGLTQEYRLFFRRQQRSRYRHHHITLRHTNLGSAAASDSGWRRWEVKRSVRRLRSHETSGRRCQGKADDGRKRTFSDLLCHGPRGVCIRIQNERSDNYKKHCWTSREWLFRDLSKSSTDCGVVASLTANASWRSFRTDSDCDEKNTIDPSDVDRRRFQRKGGWVP